MWKPFYNSGTLYITQMNEKDSEFNISLTNLEMLWENSFTLEKLVHGFKDCNPLIEATDETVKNNALDVFENIGECEVKIDEETDELHLQIQRKLSEEMKSQRLVYKFKLVRREQTLFKDKITVPLIQTVYYLEKQQKMMLCLIERKDRELEEYRMEKGDISRADLKTEKFNGELLQTGNKLFLNVFKESLSDNFWTTFMEENGNVEVPIVSVSTEPWNLKQKKRKIYNSKTIVKKGSGISFNNKK